MITRKFVWAPKGEVLPMRCVIDVASEPSSVYTVLSTCGGPVFDTKTGSVVGMRPGVNTFDPETVPAISNDDELFHNRDVFYEDHIHDWMWKNGKLHYYSRVSPGGGHWVLLEYNPEHKFRPRSP